jgi:hypothetical protein
MTKKRTIVLESFVTVSSFDCDHTVANTIDEDYKLGESTTMEAINHFNIII